MPPNPTAMRIPSIALALALLAPAGQTAAPASSTHGPSRVLTGDGEVTLTNGIVSRTWDREALRTTGLSGPGVDLTTPHADFSLVIDGARVPSDLLPIEYLQTGTGEGSAWVGWTLGAPLTFEVWRTVTVYDGIAGFESQTVIYHRTTPVALSGYTLDEVAAGPEAAATIHSFRAGADWREPGWSPALKVGDANEGDWRATTSGAPGEALRGTGEWLSLALPGGGRVGMVLERRDYASSVMGYDGSVGAAEVDLSRDIVYTGPIEEDAHAQNPGPGPARHRILAPDGPLALEPVFTILAADADAEPWAFHRYLTERRMGAPYRKAVVFNSNGIEDNIPEADNDISTGAKDNLNFDRFKLLVPAAREIGIDTFVLDDGWQAASGDWCPDSDACPEPRRNRDQHKFRARFPDDTFDAVRRELKGDPDDPTDDIALGLWMTPMEFHPASKAYQTNPQWACAPVGDGTAAASVVQPDSSSFEAGEGVWNPLALGVHPDTGEPMRLIDYVEDRVLRAIEVYGATYFKFDFLVWVDCGGVEPVTMYEYRDAFVEMVDRVLAKHPEVTIEIDETNDYRMFPYESTARGPAWFVNGSPSYTEALHTLWDLAPYVPGFSLGQATASNRGPGAAHGIDTLMAAGLTSHLTIWAPLDTAFTSAERARMRRWTDFYKANRDALGAFTYPLENDPGAGVWTALQTWDADSLSGFLLAFNQGAPKRSAEADFREEIALRGLGLVDGSKVFNLVRIDPANPGVTVVETRTAAELRAGLTVAIGAPHGYAIYKITPA